MPFAPGDSLAMKTLLLIAHLIAIAMGTGMSIANFVNLRIFLELNDQ